MDRRKKRKYLIYKLTTQTSKKKKKLQRTNQVTSRRVEKELCQLSCIAVQKISCLKNSFAYSNIFKYVAVFLHTPYSHVVSLIRYLSVCLSQSYQTVLFLAEFYQEWHVFHCPIISLKLGSWEQEEDSIIVLSRDPSPPLVLSGKYWKQIHTGEGEQCGKIGARTFLDIRESNH